MISEFLYQVLSIRLREEEKQLLAEKAHTIWIVLQQPGDNLAFFEEEIQWGIKTIDYILAVETDMGSQSPQKKMRHFLLSSFMFFL